jgi:hypothetical protein
VLPSAARNAAKIWAQYPELPLTENLLIMSERLAKTVDISMMLLRLAFSTRRESHDFIMITQREF